MNWLVSAYATRGIELFLGYPVLCVDDPSQGGNDGERKRKCLVLCRIGRESWVVLEFVKDVLIAAKAVQAVPSNPLKQGTKGD